MEIIHKIKLLLGLEKPPAPVHVPTVLERLQAELQTAAAEQKTTLLQNAQQTSENLLEQFLQTRGPLTSDADPVVWQHFELLVYVYQQLHPQTVSGGVDPLYEQLLGKLVATYNLLAQPAVEVLSAIEAYVQRFEESLLLREASGTYSFAISENKTVIRFPVMQPKAVKQAHIEEAGRVLAGIFKESRELSLLELQTRVPWVPISFLEIRDIAEKKSLVCIKQAGAQEYYGFLS